MLPAIWDVLIVGAGPAGLSAALTLSRALHTTAVFDSGVYRNRLATHMHTLPTWDHRNPQEFRDAARTEALTRYDTVQFYDVAIESVTQSATGGLFEAVSHDGRHWRGRKVILATGVRDVLPEIEGYESCWVRGIFHCLFCHGYEERGAPSAGVLAIDDLAAAPPALHLARNARRLADRVTIYTDGAEDLAATLTAQIRPEEGIHVETVAVSRLHKEPEGSNVTMTLEDGRVAREGFLVHRPRLELNGPFAQQLKLELTPQGDLWTAPPFGETSLKGVFAAGDCAALGKTVTNAIATGSFAGAGVAAQLQAEPTPVQEEEEKEAGVKSEL